MPSRFIAIIMKGPLDGCDSDLNPLPAALLPIFRNYGQIWIYADSANSLSAIGTGGTIIGDLFRKDNQPLPMTGDLCLSPDGVQSLLDTCWGSYVAIVQRSTNTVEVLRDPSGALPCYFVLLQDRVILTSDVETLQNAGLMRAEIDWDFLAQHLYYTDLRTPQSALHNVSELLPGQRMTISRERVSIDEAWSPLRYTKPSLGAVTPEDLHDVVTNTVRAWASRFKRISLGVSGGLDSSIVAAALKGHADCVYFTFATEEIDGDERRYARQLATHLGIELREVSYRLDDVNITQTVSAHLPRPVGFAFGQSLYRYLLALSEHDDVQAWFSGIGGDNVFCYMASATPFLDRLKAEGPVKAWSTLLDVCDLTGATIWTALGNAYEKAIRGQQQTQFTGNAIFLAERKFNTERPRLHPWLQESSESLPGKLVHVGMLARIHGTVDGMSRLAPALRTVPLLSQPILEACLSIPTWAWVDGGRDRAAARQAFSRDLPEALLNRRSKGGPSSFAYAVVSQNRAQLRAHLLDGLLAGKGVVDAKAVEKALTGNKPLSALEMSRLSTLAEAEAWARHWTTLCSTV